MNIQSHIKDVIKETSQQGPQEPLHEQDLLRALREKGVVEDIMQQLQFDTGHGHMSTGAPATHFVDKDDRVTATTTMKRGE